VNTRPKTEAVCILVVDEDPPKRETFVYTEHLFDGSRNTKLKAILPPGFERFKMFNYEKIYNFCKYES
jgi:hypothetical protein